MDGLKVRPLGTQAAPVCEVSADDRHRASRMTLTSILAPLRDRWRARRHRRLLCSLGPATSHQEALTSRQDGR
jgi:hypothetical protein